MTTPDKGPTPLVPLWPKECYDRPPSVWEMSSSELADAIENEETRTPQLIKVGCLKLGWSVQQPYAQWDYPHCITEEGGVLPFSVQGLISNLRSHQ